VSDISLIATLKNLKGNPRACVFTEPLWGIPYNLYAPYVSVYMLALGVNDSQIGLITSIGLAFQIAFALISGAITDKFGRKRTTLISDFVSWSIPTLIWAVSQNFTYFLAAAIVNSTWRISSNSWTCMLVEDAEQDQMVNIWALIYVSGLLAAFFSPLAGVLVNAFTLVPTVRGLYVFAFVMMTAKFLVMNHFAHETRQGLIRMDETRGQSLFSLLRGYRQVLGQLLHSPSTLYTMGIMAVASIGMTVSGAFWGILVTQKLNIPSEHLPLFTFSRSVLLLMLYFWLIPRLSRRHFKQPMLVGLAGYIFSLAMLVLMPEKNYVLLVLATLIEAFSAALVSPFMDAMIVKTVDPAERARIMALLYVVVIVLTTPFGWIAGQLSAINRVLPFVLNMVLYALGGVLVWAAARASQSVPSDAA